MNIKDFKRYCLQYCNSVTVEIIKDDYVGIDNEYGNIIAIYNTKKDTLEKYI
jgi:hypothetical protein